MALARHQQLRRAFIKVTDSARDWVVAARADLYPQQEVRLARFDEPVTYERFQVTTDKVLGGRTDADFYLKQYEHFAAGCFEGSIDFPDEDPASRGGFASFRTTAAEKEHALGAYEAVEMRVKTDGRPYILNMKSSRRSAQHLWQMRIITAPHRWVTVAFPFDEMLLTFRGRVELAQQAIPRDSIDGFGVLLADGHNGPFRFEVQHLTALARFDRRAYVSPPQQMIEAVEARAARTQEEQQQQQHNSMHAESSDASSSPPNFNLSTPDTSPEPPAPSASQRASEKEQRASEKEELKRVMQLREEARLR